jgi:hypothetical protein
VNILDEPWIKSPYMSRMRRGALLDLLEGYACMSNEETHRDVHVAHGADHTRTALDGRAPVAVSPLTTL